MDKFRIISESEKLSSVNRTIRFKADIYEKFLYLSESHHITFNKVINQALEYALDNLEEEFSDFKEDCQ